MYFLELILFFATILIQKECFAGDGSIQLHEGPNKITEYYAKDQCMAQPGYYHLHHFSFAFYLHEHHICGGGPKGMDGLLICYRSQLEKSVMLPMGMQPTRQYELHNVAGNGVAERCQALAGPDWHGLLINTNDQRNWVFRFSTTNRTFTIGGEMEILEWLYYKLASAKDVGESFLSKTFDPYRDFMKWKNDHFGEAEEKENQIRHMGNEKLKRLFMERQAMQERLQNYAGIWSLGLDMLPTKSDIDYFELIVQISECCQDIRAFFNQPTAQMPDPNPIQIETEEGPIKNHTSIVENYTIILIGFIKSNAERMALEIVDQFGNGELQYIVNFEKESITFEGKIDNKKVFPDSIATNHFVRGAPFQLMVILNKEGMIVNVNCNGPQTLNAPIAFENPYSININGDYKYIKYDHTDVSNSTKSWMIEIDGDGLSTKNSGGIMFQGKVDDNAKKFSIKLLQRAEDESYKSILELEVYIESPHFKISKGDDEKSHSDPPYYSPGSQFEAIFRFADNGFDIWMDNVPIYRTEKDLQSIVHFAQIVGDATANMTKIRKNWVNCSYEMSSKSTNQNLNIVGKILPEKNETNIQELNIFLMTNQNKLHLNMTFLMNENSTELIITEQFDKNTAIKQQRFEQLPIKLGEIFHLDIYYKSASELGLSVNEHEQEIIFVAKEKLSETNWIRIGDDYECFIIMQMDMTNCSAWVG